MLNISNFKSELTSRPYPVLVFVTVFVLFSLFPFLESYSEEIPLNSVNEKESEQGILHALWGQPTMNSMYLGMWSYHFVDDDEEYQSTHDLIGFTYKGVFVGTFENSSNDRIWGIGFQRDIYRTTWGVLSTEMGYRLGMMYGYDKMQLFDSGLFPLLQLYSDVRYKNVGIQFSWGGSVLTAGFLVRF